MKKKQGLANWLTIIGCPLEKKQKIQEFSGFEEDFLSKEKEYVDENDPEIHPRLLKFGDVNNEAET